MFTLFGTPINTITVVSIIAAIVMLVVADRIVRATRLGRGIRAVSQDAETSSLMGVNIDRTITITFILGGALAGAAGFLYSLQSGIVQNAGTEIGIYAFTAAVPGWNWQPSWRRPRGTFHRPLWKFLCSLRL